MKILPPLFTAIVCLLLVSYSATADVTDWANNTQTSAVLSSNQCTTLLMNIKPVWTGDCEGSYAAMVASVIQDNICIAFDKKTFTDATLKKEMVKIRVSYQDILCTCEKCHQFPGSGCQGGSVINTLNYLKDEGFVGGGMKTYSTQAEITGDIWKNDFSWKYANCLGFFKEYCELGGVSADKCTEIDKNQFDKSKHCGSKPTSGTELMCPNKTDKKISEVRQKGIYTGFTKVSQVNGIKAALKNGPLVSTMELYSDIFFYSKSTIYTPLSGGSMGQFAVKIIGYAKNQQNEEYWKVLLPFDANLGENGLVYIKAGLNIGDIEQNVYSVTVETNLKKST